MTVDGGVEVTRGWQMISCGAPWRQQLRDKCDSQQSLVGTSLKMVFIKELTVITHPSVRGGGKKSCSVTEQ